jgi:hypothetical protein
LREFFDNGKVRIEGSYRRGQKDGLETRYSESGEKASETTFRNGQVDGKRIEWNGKQKTYEADFTKDQLNGTLQKWHSTGTPELAAHYRNGIQEGPEDRWYSDGRKYSAASFKVARNPASTANGIPAASQPFCHLQKRLARRKVPGMVCRRRVEGPRAVFGRHAGRRLEGMERVG